jgi:hypothetical protein
VSDEAKKGFLTLTPEGSHDMLSEGTVVFNVRDHEWNKKIEKVSNPANGATRIEMSKTKSEIWCLQILQNETLVLKAKSKILNLDLNLQSVSETFVFQTSFFVTDAPNK